MNYKEFLASDFACPCARCRLSSVPGHEVNPRIITAVNRIQTLLASTDTIQSLPLVITSGVRCAEHNKAVGGAPDSYHLVGLACDLRCITSAWRWSLVSACMQQREVTMIEVAPEHIHIDVRLSAVPKMILGAG